MNESKLNLSTSPSGETINVDQKLEELTEQIIKKFNANKKEIYKWKQRFYRRFFEGPRKEISHDWHVVNTFLERAIDKFKKGYPNQKNNSELLYTLAQIKAYLTLAKIERDFAQAWTYLNLADSLLPFVVSVDELHLCTVRLQSRDEVLPEDLKKSLPKNIENFFDGKNSKKSKHIDKYSILNTQEIRALLWNSSNRKISLRLSLWRRLGAYLFIGLSIAVIVAEILKYNFNMNRINSLFDMPFLTISLLGFFGGGISAFLTARDKAVDITSYQTLIVYTFLRMLLGAAGSFVVFIALNWIGNEEIKKQLRENIFAFLGTGIAAGFSEKLFVNTLEKMADKLDIISKLEKEDKC